jgi:hypothetical protein
MGIGVAIVKQASIAGKVGVAIRASRSSMFGIVKDLPFRE